MFSAKHNSISYRRVTLLLYFLLMMFYFTHMCDVLIVLCYMYLCIVFSFCSSIILFALSTIILVYYGQHTIMRSANIYYNHYKLTDQNVVLYSSTAYYVHG